MFFIKNLVFIREAGEPLRFQSPNPLGPPMNSSTPINQQNVNVTGGPIRNNKNRLISRINSYKK